MSFSASNVHAAATMALVDAIAGMMFFTTPPVSCQVTPCTGIYKYGLYWLLLRWLTCSPASHARSAAATQVRQAGRAKQPPGNPFCPSKVNNNNHVNCASVHQIHMCNEKVDRKLGAVQQPRL